MKSCPRSCPRTLPRFCTQNSKCIESHPQIAKARAELEQQTLEAASTSEAVNIITDVQSLKRRMKQWERQVATYRDGQRILERQRFHFPQNWLHVDNVEGEWSAFNEIIRQVTLTFKSGL